MNRRDYLAAVGTAAATALAGCGGDSDTPTPTAEPTDTPEAADTPTQTATETQTPTETATPEPSEMQQRIDDRAAEADAIFEAYVASDDAAAEPADVPPSAGLRDLYDQIQDYHDSVGVLRRLQEEGTEEEQADIDKLLAISDYFTELYNLHDDLRSVPRTLERIWGYVQNGDRTGPTFGQLDERLSDARDRYDRVDDIDASSFDVLSAVGPTNYENRLESFDAGIEAYETMEGAISDIESALIDVRNATREYTDDNYDSASADFFQASGSFSDVVNDLDQEWPDDLTNRDLPSETTCVAEAGEDICAAMDDAAQSGESQDRRALAEDQAEQHFDSACDVVGDVSDLSELESAID